jgi:hypothetical protein
MPRYLASHHAVDRLLERFPAIATLAGQGTAAALWLAERAAQAQVAAQQTGMDLLLYLDLPVTAGWIRVYLPVTPQGRHDTWVIRTVLTPEQAAHNVAVCASRWQERCRDAWRARKMDRRAA